MSLKYAEMGGKFPKMAVIDESTCFVGRFLSLNAAQVGDKLVVSLGGKDDLASDPVPGCLDSGRHTIFNSTKVYSLYSGE